MTVKTMDFETIKKFLPHRYPFLLVDRVLSVSENSIQALKNVTGNEPFFNGHFPELAVMPGVLQIEAMAQAAGLILALKEDFDIKNNLFVLAGVDNAKFKRIVTPGDQLILEAAITAQKARVIKFEACAKVSDQIASLASITLVEKPLPHSDFT
ncbi:MAG TPA: 3-hydroxyacyl-ACP dehydratase FabZ [Myxococcota bacterium]|nr:3-hydroxyacyl-ACP dehydratase FabZ [Myxococcota bacterium]